MSRSMAHFQSSIVRIDLTPDSRGYVLFNVSRQDRDDTNLFHPLTSLDVLTCEYIADLAIVSMHAMDWIDRNCEEITHEKRHLYYKFKELPDVRTVPGESGGSDQSSSGLRGT